MPLPLQSLLGLVVFIVLTWLLGRALAWRRGEGFVPGEAVAQIPWRVVTLGLALQFGFALLVLKTPGGDYAFKLAERGALALLGFALEGAAFLFGGLTSFDPLPVSDGETTVGTLRLGAGFAFNILPTIIVFSSFAALLYHVGVMKWIVGGIAWVMRRTMRTSGAETLSAAANVFFGQTEAPLFIKPFLAKATRSELHAIMVGGFANIASGVLGAYAGLLAAAGIQGGAGHLLAASLISAPAGLICAKLLVPETQHSETAGDTPIHTPRPDANLIDAAARGALDGLYLALNVGAMLIAFVAIVALLNGVLSFVDVAGEPLTLQRILGWLFVPLAWLCGVPVGECPEFGTLVGLKTTLNEYFGYARLASGYGEGGTAYLSDRTVTLAIYALCGFANFASVAIQIGGIGSLAPERRRDLSELGLLAMVGGTIASLMTACVVGVIVW